MPKLLRAGPGKIHATRLRVVSRGDRCENMTMTEVQHARRIEECGPAERQLVGPGPPVSHRAVALDVFQATLVDTRL